MPAQLIIEEITRGLSTPDRGAEIVDMADGRKGKLLAVNRPSRVVSAKFGQKIFKIPFRSLRWDTTRNRWVWWGLRD